ncbi:MAG: NAD(P)H-dependent oxidoreductase [Clostridiales bacterium]|nr:NAD(P)H-dependent oxidoreductase [Clostridiales bacterium]
MFILGLAFGHRLGNSEIMVKLALKEAEKMSAEVGFVNGLYLNMSGCRDCSVCFNNVEEGKASYTKCIIPDDATALHEVMLDADAIVIAGAVYSMGMPAAMVTLFERTHTDLAHFKRVRKRREEEGGEPLDPRVFKPRPLGLISQGGSRYHHWVSMGTQQISKFGMSANNCIVDMLDIYDMTRRGGILGDEALMERCRQMGRNLVEAVEEVASGEDKPAYRGDVNGICPVCHLDMLSVDGTDEVMCPLCGIKGKIAVQDGKLTVDFSDEQQSHSKFYWQGLQDHQIELQANLEERFAMMKERGLSNEQLAEMKKEYRGYAEIKLK